MPTVEALLSCAVSFCGAYRGELPVAARVALLACAVGMTIFRQCMCLWWCPALVPACVYQPHYRLSLKSSRPSMSTTMDTLLCFAAWHAICFSQLVNCRSLTCSESSACLDTSQEGTCIACSTFALICLLEFNHPVLLSMGPRSSPITAFLPLATNALSVMHRWLRVTPYCLSLIHI